MRTASEHCPDRSGPREILMWDRGGGWKTVRVNGTNADRAR